MINGVTVTARPNLSCRKSSMEHMAPLSLVCNRQLGQMCSVCYITFVPVETFDDPQMQKLALNNIKCLGCVMKNLCDLGMSQ